MKNIKSRKTKQIVQIIDAKNETIRYMVFSESSQYKITKEIVFEGFKKLPQGFYRDGYGLARPAGTFLLQAIAKGVDGKVKLIITKKGDNLIKRFRKGVYSVALRHQDYWELMLLLREITAERNEKSRAIVATKLGEIFPSFFSSKQRSFETLYSYTDDKFTKIINKDEDIVSKLSINDVSAIVGLYNKILSNDLIGRKRKDIKVLAKGKAVTQRVYLEKVISLFEERLDQLTASESSWQQFLGDFILLFNTSYVDVIEKLNISLGGKYPDFVLLNGYNFIDVYEIKKPQTNLLKLDASRGNYYWDSELAKAISQTENYIHLLNRNALAVREEVAKTKKIDIKVVRPRGYIIAGTNKQLDDAKMQDDFRLLANSLKNIEVILYDELLNSLKHLASRLEIEVANEEREN